MTYEITQAEAAELNDRLAAIFSAVAVASGKDKHKDYARGHMSELGIVTITET